jgi:hypothetical protein
MKTPIILDISKIHLKLRIFKIFHQKRMYKAYMYVRDTCNMKSLSNVFVKHCLLVVLQFIVLYYLVDSVSNIA